MSLQASVTRTLRGVADRVRRDAIAYAICAVCAVAVLILITWAAVLSLVPVVGPVYAPLIVAGAFVVAIAVTMVWLQFANGRRRQPAIPLHVSANADTAQRQAQFAQIAMIVEALMLGFSLSRRFDRH
jgi:chromate transport protein ChrA